jgi:hypothetical protein
LQIRILLAILWQGGFFMQGTMAKRVLGAVIVMMVIACGFAIYQKNFGEETRPESRLEKRFPTNLLGTQKTQLPPLIQEINEKIATIRTLDCAQVELKIWKENHRLRLKGSLICSRPNLFRLEVSSLLGKELDLGSNEKAFWYWSKRDRDPGLHFSTHENFTKTRLKTPFNPLFIRSTLGIEELKEGCQVRETEKDYVLTYPRVGGSGEPLNFSVFVSKEKKQVEGYLVTTAGGKTVVLCEIQQYSGDVPSQILYSWLEENSVMLITMERITVNGVIDPTRWALPNYSPKKDIGNGE